MYEIGIEEFYKNSNDKSPSPDGSGNPPDFFSGDYFTYFYFHWSSVNFVYNAQQELHFQKKPKPFAPEN